VYGSSAARALYGQGDFQRRSGYAGGYYAAGGFFSGLRKLAGGVVKTALKSPLVKSFASSLPVVGGAITAFDMLKGIGGGSKGGLAATLTPLKPAITGGAATGKLSLPHIAAAAKVGKSSRRKTRKKATRRRKASSTRRRRKTRLGQGDYGDDWSGSKPSRDKSGRYLTRAGGRRHHAAPPRRRRRRRGGHRRGGNVSFTTKDGRHVSFTAKGRDALGPWAIKGGGYR